MRVTTIHGPGDIRIEQAPDPEIIEPTDSIVRVTHSCVCGSDLWAYRGIWETKPGQRTGHEFVGVVEEAGSGVRSLRPGDSVVAPFMWSDGACPHCERGLQSSCPAGGLWGQPGADGGQAEYVRVPYADSTLVVIPGGLDGAGDDARAKAVLALSDVMATGHHAALTAGVAPGATVAVVGDGAVGLCGVLAAHRLGAERIVLVGRHRNRMEVGVRFGATHPVLATDADVAPTVRELTDGLGADAVLECVGTANAWRTALDICRDGGCVGVVGVPHQAEPVDPWRLFERNVGIRGGLAPARAYIPELLDDVLQGRLDPSPVFDVTVGLNDVATGYGAMDRRAAIKVHIRP